MAGDTFKNTSKLPQQTLQPQQFLLQLTIRLQYTLLILRQHQMLSSQAVVLVYPNYQLKLPQMLLSPAVVPVLPRQHVHLPSHVYLYSQQQVFAGYGSASRKDWLRLAALKTHVLRTRFLSCSQSGFFMLASVRRRRNNRV